MKKKIEALEKDIQAYQGDALTFRQRFSGRKGVLADLFKALANLPADERNAMGKRLNVLKGAIEAKQQALENATQAAQGHNAGEHDPTLPPVGHPLGSVHPLTRMANKVVRILEKIGFRVEQAGEIENDFYNFSALNFPKDHPARDMQETFFLDKQQEWLLRTHTSNVQVRVMSNGKPPFRVVAPGRVFRRENISSRTHCMFHQIEAFYVDEGVSLADLKGLLRYLIKQLFGPDKKMRLRPSFFPFTEPSVEVDMGCLFCEQKGCSTCKQSGWLEILGAGMIDPNVLKACQIDGQKYSGYALGMGVERLAMLHHRIQDLRLFTQNDVRFLAQFPPFP